MMNTLRFLGTSGSIGAPTNGTTTLLVNQVIAIEAGSGLLGLDLESLLKVKHVVLSHAHFDHICGLPLLVELHKQRGTGELLVYGHKATIETLKANVFNDDLWPDFTQIPSKEEPSITFVEIRNEQFFYLNGLTIRPVLVNHTVSAFGFVIQGHQGSLAYSGDTAVSEYFENELVKYDNLRHLVVECSFPVSQAKLAELTGHLCSSNVAALRKKLRVDTHLWLVSIKQWFRKEIENEIKNDPSSTVMALAQMDQELMF